MIQSEHAFDIDSPISNVWAYVEDIPGWASLFPGHQGCNVINENDSEWIIKVSAAGVTRTDTVKVHVEEWDGPNNVTFNFDVIDLPVVGNGRYSAEPISTSQTRVTLTVCIIGSGPMAPMWEAVGTPMLPEFVKAFAAKLKADIEFKAGVGTVSADEKGFALPMMIGVMKSSFAAFKMWIKSLFGIATKNSN